MRIRIGQWFEYDFGDGSLVTLRDYVCVSVFLLLSLGKGADADDKVNVEAEALPYHDGTGLVIRLATEQTFPFAERGHVPSRTPRLKHFIDSIESFPSVRDCLKKEEMNAPQPDLSAFDWDRIDSLESATVCIWRVASSYRGIDDVELWLFDQGFDVSPRFRREEAGAMREGLSATWPMNERGLLFTSNLLYDWWTRTTAFGPAVAIDFTDNSEIDVVGISYTRK